MRRKSLEQLKEKKFNILEEVKSVNIGNEMAVTISIGIGINADSFAHTSEAARIAMELALGRGGDQVVIKEAQQHHVFWRQISDDGKDHKGKSKSQGTCAERVYEQQGQDCGYGS